MHQNSQNFHIVVGAPYENSKYKEQDALVKRGMKELYNDTFNHVVKSESLNQKKTNMNDALYFLHDAQSMGKLSKDQNNKNLHIHSEGHSFISGLLYNSEFDLSPQKMALMIQQSNIPNIQTISLDFCNSATEGRIDNKNTSFAKALSEELSKFDNTKNISVSGVTGSLEIKDSGKITNVIATGSESQEKNRKEKKVTASYEDATSTYIDGKEIKKGKELTESGYYNKCSENYAKIWRKDSQVNEQFRTSQHFQNDLPFSIGSLSPSSTPNVFSVSSLQTVIPKQKKE